MTEQYFSAKLEIIGVNPFVSVPDQILQSIFADSGKQSGPIPVSGTVNDCPYKQTLMKFKGQWRLYINTSMLKDSPKRIGEAIAVTVAFDPADRRIAPHPKWTAALDASPQAKAAFDSLPPSRRHEIVRYIASLKTEESVERNVKRAIGFLRGEGSFVGRDKP